MMKDYKVFSCLRPKKIFNKSSQSFVTVGCGYCSACINKRSSRNSLLCSIEESDFDFCVFVTLTYKNEFVPLMRPEKRLLSHVYYDEFKNRHVVNDSYTYDFYDVTERFSSKDNVFGRFLFSHNISPLHLRSIQRKIANKSSHFGSDIPYLSRYDVTCFMKRFRKLLTKYSNEKIRVYIVGEYGPVHFRPHFHLLLFFNSKEVLQNYRKCLCLAWSKRTRCYDKRKKKFYYKSTSFGRIDASLSRGKCSSYVSKYVNSFTSLPRLYQYNSVRPFSSHSIHFAQSFYKDKKKEIYEKEPVFFVNMLRSVCSKPLELHPWRSLISLLFPKVRGYCNKSFDELLYSYRLLQKARCFYSFGSVRELSKLVLSDLIKCSIDCNFIYDYKVHCKSSKDYFLSYVAYSVGVVSPDMIPYYSESEYDKLLCLIDSLFYVSNHFLSFVCENESYFETSLKVRKIVDFYSYLDKINLSNMLSFQSSLIEYNGIEILPYFYDNSLADLDNVSAFSSLRSYLDFMFYENYKSKENIKHKYLNDLNEIYLNY